MRSFFRSLLLFSIVIFSAGSLFAHSAIDKGHLRSEKKYYVCACALFHNEARFLKEWIEFHRLVGVEHFYLFNNQSCDEYQRVLVPYIQQGIVSLIDWDYSIDERGWGWVQRTAYQFAVEISREDTEWLAILDTDEYLFPVKKRELRSVLKKYEEFAAVCVNWQMFGTSFVQRIPEGSLLIESLLMKAPLNHSENIHIKSVVRPAYVERCVNPHYCLFLPGYYQVNEDKVPFEGPFAPYVSVEKLRINHYWSRDIDFFLEEKIPRRAKWGEGVDGCLERVDNLNQEPDDVILRFVAPLRRRMFLNE